MHDEIWVDVKGWEGLYKVSNLGRVYSCSRGTIKKPTVRKSGYVVLSLICRPRHMWKQYKLHRLVAENFIPNPCNLPDINHIDENKQNNAASNLEWCTKKYNSNYGHCREKISKALMGNTNSVGSKNGMYGKHHSPEIREKISKAVKEHYSKQKSFN